MRYSVELVQNTTMVFRSSFFLSGHFAILALKVIPTSLPLTSPVLFVAGLTKKPMLLLVNNNKHFGEVYDDRAHCSKASPDLLLGGEKKYPTLSLHRSTYPIMAL